MKYENYIRTYGNAEAEKKNVNKRCVGNEK